MDELNIMVVARDPLARAGLASLLENDEQLAIVGELSPTEITDWFSPDAHAIVWDADAQDVALFQDIDLAVLALVTEDSDIAKLLNADITGILYRTAEVSRIIVALRALIEGVAVLEPELLASLQSPQIDDALLLDDLTPREFEVLERVSEGLSNKAIAKALNISEHTVKFHINALLSKFGVSSRTELAVRAIQTGLISI